MNSTNVGKYIYRGITRRLRRFMARVEDWRFNRRFPLPKGIEEEIRQVRNEIPEEFCACPLEKGKVLAHFIIKHKLKRTVEIGVYYGSSLFPQVIAQTHTGGVAIGIDPYLFEEAKQFNNREFLDPIQEFVDSIDWDAMYQGVLDIIKRHDFSDYCRILRMTSDQAVDLIESELDMVHIDGNHDRARVVSDIEHYLSKLRVGGFLALDDIGWPSIAPEYAKLKQSMKLIYEKYNSAGNGWGLLQKV
jgi:predicted O-methyltransferase YrrM